MQIGFGVSSRSDVHPLLILHKKNPVSLKQRKININIRKFNDLWIGMVV